MDEQAHARQKTGVYGFTIRHLQKELTTYVSLLLVQGRRRTRQLAGQEEQQQHRTACRRDKVFRDCVKPVVVDGVDCYEPELGTGERDTFIVDLLALAISFRKIENIGGLIQHSMGKVAIVSPSCSREKASRVATAACLVSLQLLHEVAHEFSWVNALACDSSYLDSIQVDALAVRIRLGVDCEVYSFHLAAVPLFETKKADDVVDGMRPLLDAVDSDWRQKIAGSATDGENKMTGVHVGVSTQLEAEARDAGATDEFIRIWDPCHQLDNALHRALTALEGVPTLQEMKRLGVQAPESHPTQVSYMRRLRELATALRGNKSSINATRKSGRHINCPGTV
eukprot:GHVU01141633.1.p1 GENE.GHVU01141633.1~~GHVU01141633.1.p1  ORF type:complete len:339 (-),score=37.80 GHVU01141633.1:470-1486(-)